VDLENFSTVSRLYHTSSYRVYLHRVSQMLMDSYLIDYPLTVSCFSIIQIGFYLSGTGPPGYSPGQRAVKRVCVCVCNYLAEYCDERVCLFISLSVCPRRNLKNHMSKRQLWPWLCPPPAALRYVMYFRLYEWRHICNGPHVDIIAASDVTASSCAS